MKLKNPMIITELRKFYIENKWNHNEVRDYIRDHYDINVSFDLQIRLKVTEPQDKQRW